MKKVFWIGGALAAMGLLIALYMWNKPHRNVSETRALYQVTAADLSHTYMQSAEAANQRYLDEVIAVSGTVTQINDASVTLDETVYAAWDSTFISSEIIKGQALKIKGRVVGYDDLFGQVKLDFCRVVD